MDAFAVVLVFEVDLLVFVYSRLWWFEGPLFVVAAAAAGVAFAAVFVITDPHACVLIFLFLVGPPPASTSDCFNASRSELMLMVITSINDSVVELKRFVSTLVSKTTINRRNEQSTK